VSSLLLFLLRFVFSGSCSEFRFGFGFAVVVVFG